MDESMASSTGIGDILQKALKVEAASVATTCRVEAHAFLQRTALGNPRALNSAGSNDMCNSMHSEGASSPAESYASARSDHAVVVPAGNRASS